MHTPGGIRTRNPSKQAAADPRLRPRGHWDRHYSLCVDISGTGSLHRHDIPSTAAPWLYTTYLALRSVVPYVLDCRTISYCRHWTQGAPKYQYTNKMHPATQSNN